MNIYGGVNYSENFYGVDWILKMNMIRTHCGNRKGRFLRTGEVGWSRTRVVQPSCMYVHVTAKYATDRGDWEKN